MKYDVQNYVPKATDNYVNMAFQSTSEKFIAVDGLRYIDLEFQHFHVGTLPAITYVLLQRKDFQKFHVFLCSVALCYHALRVFCAHELFLRGLEQGRGRTYGT
jgi:hypothetical protein